MKNKIIHIRLKLRILFNLIFHKFATFLEVAVIPILLMGTLALAGFVLLESIEWYNVATKLEATEQIKAKNEIMRTLAQILGGAFVLTGLYFTAKNVFVSRRGQMTDRFKDALENLGETDNLLKRIGGIHALESIARDSPKDHWRIMEIFADFIRINTIDSSYTNSKSQILNEKRKPRADIQQVLEAIGRRNRAYLMGENRRLDLSGANLEGADLREANLEGVIFKGANLRRAILQKAHLKRADFSGANLENVNLNLADLTNTNFHQASLKNAQLRNAILKNTSFAMAQMQEASFENTYLYKVYLANAVLDEGSFENAYLKKCHFFDASLIRTSFEGAKITNPVELSEKQFKKATINNKTQLPKYFKKPII